MVTNQKAKCIGLDVDENTTSIATSGITIVNQTVNKSMRFLFDSHDHQWSPASNRFNYWWAPQRICS